LKKLGFKADLRYNINMEKIDITGLMPEQIEYILNMEMKAQELSETIEAQKIRIDNLMCECQ
jgi:hypothetical protein